MLFKLVLDKSKELFAGLLLGMETVKSFICLRRNIGLLLLSPWYKYVSCVVHLKFSDGPARII